jgi:hypothetical protein
VHNKQQYYVVSIYYFKLFHFTRFPLRIFEVSLRYIVSMASKSETDRNIAIMKSQDSYLLESLTGIKGGLTFK